MADQFEETEKVTFANKPKLFGKWAYDEIKVQDLCFKDYIAVTATKT